MLNLPALFASMKFLVSLNARKAAFPRDAWVVSRFRSGVVRSGQLKIIDVYKETIRTMHNDNTALAELRLMRLLQVQERLLEERAEEVRLVEPHDAVIGLHLLERAQHRRLVARERLARLLLLVARVWEREGVGDLERAVEVNTDEQSQCGRALRLGAVFHEFGDNLGVVMREYG